MPLAEVAARCRYEQNIGLVQDVHFPAGPSKTAILSTEAGIITSLNLRNNKIGKGQKNLFVHFICLCIAYRLTT